MSPRPHPGELSLPAASADPRCISGHISDLSWRIEEGGAELSIRQAQGEIHRERVAGRPPSISVIGNLHSIVFERVGEGRNCITLSHLSYVSGGARQQWIILLDAQ